MAQVYENEEGMYLETAGQTQCLDDRDVVIPSFDGKTYARELKILFYETMVNCVDGGFCKNYLLSPEIDGSMSGVMGLFLESTGNTSEIRFDHYLENDSSLGQTLLLAWLADPESAVVDELVLEAKTKYSDGTIDGSLSEALWVKYVLQRMGEDSEWCETSEDYFEGREQFWFLESRPSEEFSGNPYQIEARLFVFERNWFPHNDIKNLHYYQIRVVIPEGMKYPLSFEYDSNISEYGKMSPCARTSSELFCYLLDYDSFE